MLMFALQEYIFSEQKDVHLSLTNAKNVKDDGKEAADNDQGDQDDQDGKELKEEPSVKPPKETSYNVNYKEPLTEHMLLPTPPLPPWKGRRTVQRSYSSEMLTSDSFYGNGTGAGYCRDRDRPDRDRERETQIATESSGYHSGSLSKPHKTNSGWQASNTLHYRVFNVTGIFVSIATEHHCWTLFHPKSNTKIILSHFIIFDQ